MIHAFGDVRRRRDQIRDEGGGLAARLDDDHLVVHGVAAGPAHFHARHDRLVIVHELQHAGVRERHVIIQQIARAVAFVRMRRIFPFAPARPHIARAETAAAGGRRRRAP